MPVLDERGVRNLLDTAQAHGVCRECGQRTAMDYCRSHDQFYWIHQKGCGMYEDHGGCRLTIVPFVEVR